MGTNLNRHLISWRWFLPCRVLIREQGSLTKGAFFLGLSRGSLGITKIRKTSILKSQQFRAKTSQTNVILRVSSKAHSI